MQSITFFSIRAAKVLSKLRYLLIEIHDNPHIGRDVLINKITSFGFKEILSHCKTDNDVYCFANNKFA